MSRQKKRTSRRSRKKAGLAGIFSNLFHPHSGNNHRPKLLHPEALFYFSLIVLASFSLVKAFRFFPQLELAVLGFASNITVDQVIRGVNDQRATQNLSELVINNELSEAALAKGQDMFNDQYWSHTAPDGKEPWYFMKQANYTYKVAGENLARDFMTTGDMVKAWIASPTHRSNIMNPKFQQTGIAVIDGTLNGFETTLVVQMFGAESTRRVVADIGESSIIPQVEAAPAAEIAPAVDTSDNANQQVLAAEGLSPNVLRNSVLLTPLQLTKAFFLAVILLVVMTLIYDTFISRNRKTVRMVGKNMGHLMVFGTVAFMLIFFKGGMVN